MALYLSVHLIEDVVHDLLLGGVYTSQTPAAVVYRATWDDEKKIVGTLGNIARMVKEARITKTAVIIIGSVLDPGSMNFLKCTIRNLHMDTEEEDNKRFSTGVMN